MREKRAVSEERIFELKGRLVIDVSRMVSLIGPDKTVEVLLPAAVAVLTQRGDAYAANYLRTLADELERDGEPPSVGSAPLN